jgi:hypothetical protein
MLGFFGRGRWLGRDCRASEGKPANHHYDCQKKTTVAHFVSTAVADIGDASLPKSSAFVPHAPTTATA